MSVCKHLIQQLELKKHPEGGYFRETYRSSLILPKSALPSYFSGDRNISTSILFLLPSEECSHFHRIKSDELWLYHSGSALSIYILKDDQLIIQKLGPKIDAGEAFQVVVPANCWFGSKCHEPGSYTLSGCMVAPGFDFGDFEMAERSHLLETFPQFRSEINLLTRENT
jgi:uncharacterized protein